MFKTQVEPRATGEWFHCQVQVVSQAFSTEIKANSARNLSLLL